MVSLTGVLTLCSVVVPRVMLLPAVILAVAHEVELNTNITRSS